MIILTVKSDLKKLLATCEWTKGNYAVMAESTEDKEAEKMFNDMKADMEKHIQYLEDRLDYLNQNNQLNQKKEYKN